MSSHTMWNRRLLRRWRGWSRSLKSSHTQTVPNNILPRRRSRNETPIQRGRGLQSPTPRQSDTKTMFILVLCRWRCENTTGAVDWWQPVESIRSSPSLPARQGIGGDTFRRMFGASVLPDVLHIQLQCVLQPRECQVSSENGLADGYTSGPCRHRLSPGCTKGCLERENSAIWKWYWVKLVSWKTEGPEQSGIYIVSYMFLPLTAHFRHLRSVIQMNGKLCQQILFQTCQVLQCIRSRVRRSFLMIPNVHCGTLL